VPSYICPSARSKLISFPLDYYEKKLSISSNKLFCLQNAADEEITNLQAAADSLRQHVNWLNTRMAVMQVRFMNTADM
jgi:hypothetical protein